MLTIYRDPVMPGTTFTFSDFADNYNILQDPAKDRRELLFPFQQSVP